MTRPPPPEKAPEAPRPVARKTAAKKATKAAKTPKGGGVTKKAVKKAPIAKKK
jgi:hypothetical protein